MKKATRSSAVAVIADRTALDLRYSYCSYREALEGLKLWRRVPIHLFGHFCYTMYLLATLHGLTQTDKQTNGQTDGQRYRAIAVVSRSQCVQYDRLKLGGMSPPTVLSGSGYRIRCVSAHFAQCLAVSTQLIYYWTHITLARFDPSSLRTEVDCRRIVLQA